MLLVIPWTAQTSKNVLKDSTDLLKDNLTMKLDWLIVLLAILLIAQTLLSLVLKECTESLMYKNG